MNTIRLIRECNKPGDRGPTRGQYALQKALRKAAPEWLRIGGELNGHEIPWYWHWDDADRAALRCRCTMPVVIGPNILFRNSARPRSILAEHWICEGVGPALLVTESPWYANLIGRMLCRESRATLAVWPYPIEPFVVGRPEAHDCLLYAKSGVSDALRDAVFARWPNSVEVRYGHYHRPDFLRLAAGSRCCVYGSVDDRGPLALAEIMLTGCPAVGVLKGAPWINEETGVMVAELTPEEVLPAVERCMGVDRAGVREAAIRRFSPEVVARQAVEEVGRWVDQF